MYVNIKKRGRHKIPENAFLLNVKLLVHCVDNIQNGQKLTSRIRNKHLYKATKSGTTV